MLRSCLVASLIAVLFSTSARADDSPPSYRSGDPVPEGYHVERSSAGATTTAVGGGLVAASYLPMVFVGVMGAVVSIVPGYGGPGVKYFFVPVAGPFVLAHQAAHESPRGGTSLLLADGAMQAAGAALLAIGGLVHELSGPTLVRNTPGSDTRGALGLPHDLEVTPTFGPAAKGVALAGTF